MYAACGSVTASTAELGAGWDGTAAVAGPRATIVPGAQVREQ
jgi:hypothetical protein